MQGNLRFPRQRRTLAGQPHHVVAGDGHALVGHAQEIPTIGGGCHRQGARNAQLDVLAAIGGGDDIGQHSNVDGALCELAPNGVGQIGRDLLARWWGMLPHLDAQQQTTARCIGKGNAILGDFVPVCRLAGHRPQ
jgi:hypothetical protein